MNIKFFNKRILARKFDSSVVVHTTKNDEVVELEHQNVVEENESENSDKKTGKQKNKQTKKQEPMTESEKIEKAEVLVSELKPEVKLIKKEKGLIERTESSKIILNEDNKQILND